MKFFIAILIFFLNPLFALSLEGDPVSRHKSEVILIADSGHGYNFFTVDKDGLVLGWSGKDDLLKSEKITNLPVIQVVAYNKYDDILVAGNERTLYAIDGFLSSVINKKEIQLLETTVSSRILSVDTAEKKSLIAGAFDGTIYRWKFGNIANAKTKLEKEKLLERYVGPAEPIAAVAQHPVGHVFFAADWAGVINGFQPYDADRLSGDYQRNKTTTPYFTSSSVRQRVKRVKLTDSIKEEATHRLEKLVIAGKEGQELISATSEGTLEIWKVRGMKVVGVLVKAHIGNLFALAATDNYIATSGRDGFVRVFKIERLSEEELRKKIDRSITHNLILLNEFSVPNVRSLSFVQDKESNKFNLVAGTREGQVLAINF